jgi:hypothetical protein
MTQPTFRTAKTLESHVSGAANTLIRQYGSYLETLTPQQHCLMGAVLLDHMAGASPIYGIRDSLICVDPDCLLGRNLSETIVAVVDESEATALAALVVAIAALVFDDARNGAWA